MVSRIASAATCRSAFCRRRSPPAPSSVRAIADALLLPRAVFGKQSKVNRSEDTATYGGPTAAWGEKCTKADVDQVTLAIRHFTRTLRCLRSSPVLRMGKLPSKRAEASAGEAGAYQVRQVMGQGEVEPQPMNDVQGPGKE